VKESRGDGRCIKRVQAAQNMNDRILKS